ncbi:MAG: DUF1501 domain-containing protein [Gemmataceae bacterium]
MLTMTAGKKSRTCDGLSRRNFLRVGTLGLGGLTLADLLALDGRAAQRSILRDKSVVFLYLAGGPSQLETFDPKPDAPVEIRSMTGEIQTRLPGVLFGGSFPKLAAMADKLAIVRSFVHGNGNHDGGKKLFGVERSTALSAVYSRMLGATDAETGMMSTAFLSPQSVGFDNSGIQRQFRFYYTGISPTGPLGSLHAPFHPSSQDGRSVSREGLLSDMQLRTPLERLEDRRLLLEELSNLQRNVDHATSAGVTELRTQAFDVLQRGVREAFDLSREDPRLINCYDTSSFRTPAGLIRQERNGKMTAQSQSVLGKQLLLARRLCEAGCRFVTVGMNDWDMHGNYNSYPIPEGMALMGGALDKAVSAFLADIEQRGLSEKILLVMTGEMGRTPRITNERATQRPGRYHWARLGSLVLAGGGLTMGQVIGRSDRQAGTPVTEPVRPENLISTITHTLFDMGQVRVTRGLPNGLVQAVSAAPVIRELMG